MSPHGFMTCPIFLLESWLVANRFLTLRRLVVRPVVVGVPVVVPIGVSAVVPIVVLVVVPIVVAAVVTVGPLVVSLVALAVAPSALLVLVGVFETSTIIQIERHSIV